MLYAIRPSNGEEIYDTFTKDEYGYRFQRKSGKLNKPVAGLRQIDFDS